MNADLITLGAVAALGWMGWTIYRLGYLSGQLSARAEALKDLDLLATPVAWPPEDASPEECFAWTADCAELGPEYADGQLAYRRARVASDQRAETHEALLMGVSRLGSAVTGPSEG
jgi:hypothetical protein